MIKLNIYESPEENIEEPKSAGRYRIYLTETILVKFLMDIYKVLTVGSVGLRAQAGTEIIIILNPDFAFLVKKGDVLDRMDVARRKMVQLFLKRNNILKRYEDAKRSRPHVVEKESTKIKEYLDNHPKIKGKDPDLEIFKQAYNDKKANLVQQRYMTAFTRQVLSYDTTYLGPGWYLTILIDNASRIILGFWKTTGQPTALELIQMFSEFLTQELAERVQIVHSDCAGSTTSRSFAEYMRKRGVLISYTEDTRQNHVAETTNCYIKQLIKTHKFEDIPDEMTFEDYSEKLKMLMVKAAVELFNTLPTYPESPALQGLTRQYIDVAKEWLYKENPEFISKNIIIAKSDTKAGKFLSIWQKAVVKNFELRIKQSYIERNFDLPMLLVTEKDTKEICNLAVTENQTELTLLTKEQQQKAKKINGILETGLELRERGFSKEEIKNKIKQILINRFNNAKTEKEKSDAELALGMFEYQEIEKKELLGKINQLQELSEEWMEKANKMEVIAKNMESQLKILAEEKVAKQYKIIKRNTRKGIQSSVKLAVMPEDFPIIMKHASVGRTRYQIAKYRLAHVVLKITGIRISNLTLVNIEQLDNLFNKKTMFIKLIKNDSDVTLQFPYIKSYERYLKYAREDYKYLKECQIQGNPNLAKFDQNSSEDKIRLRSEVWGDLDRSGLTRAINKDLKLASKEIKPNKLLTSHSYRRGIAILATRLLGIKEASYILGHKNVTSTEAYVEIKPDRERVKRTLTAVHDIEDSSKAKYITYSPQEDAELNEEINKIISCNYKTRNLY